MKINVIEKKDIFFILILILIAIFGFSFNASASGESLSSYLSDNVVVLTPVSNTFYFPPNTFNASMFTSILSQPVYNRTMYPYKVMFALNDETLTASIGSGSAYFIETPYGTDMFISPIALSTSFLSTSSGSYILSQGYGEGVYVLLILNGADTPIASAYFSLSASGEIVFIDNPNVIGGLPHCGSDAGKLIETTPSNLCDVGTAGTVIFDGSKWSWDCISGAVSQSCRAYLATTEPVDGTCGAWNGETFNTWPPVAELCELITSLVVPSMVETINGYTWTCSGINGGSSDYCSGNKTSPPLMPELPAGSLDDCSDLSILEGLVCNIGNTLKTIFLPSSEKINELNQTINKMASKFPFSYISKATETFNDLKGNITETSLLELSIMESEKSSIDFSTIAFFDYIKKLTTILMIIVFSFWLIRFIKHIF